jgi:dihydroorotase-like cyclic amidohydrolase
MIKFKEDGKKFAMKLICMNTFQYDRQGIRHALIKMIRAEIMKIKQITHEAGGLPGCIDFNFHFEMPGCEINSKWSESMSMCKLCIKAKRVKKKR